MGADLNNIVKCQKLTDDHVQFLIYQILRGLKVSESPCIFSTWPWFPNLDRKLKVHNFNVEIDRGLGSTITSSKTEKVLCVGVELLFL